MDVLVYDPYVDEKIINELENIIKEDECYDELL